MIRDNKPNVVWTAELTSRVSDLWRKGVSAKDIARQVRSGTSRNGIIGKMHRLDIDPGGSTSYRRPPVRRRKVPATALDAPPSVSLPLPPPDIPLPPKPPPRPPRPPAPAHKRGGWTLLDLTSHQCRWPLNEPPRGQGDRYLFCGEGTFNGFPYCEHHARVGFSGKGTARATVKAGWVPRPVEFGR